MKNLALKSIFILSSILIVGHSNAQVTSECVNASEISCNSTVTGSTVGGSPQTFGACGTSAGSGGANWYHFVGNGGTHFRSFVVLKTTSL